MKQWGGQYEKGKELFRIEDMETLLEWYFKHVGKANGVFRLPKNVPRSPENTVVHGDFR